MSDSRPALTIEQRRRRMEKRLGASRIVVLDTFYHRNPRAGIREALDVLEDPGVQIEDVYEYWCERGYYVAQGMAVPQAPLGAGDA